MSVLSSVVFSSLNFPSLLSFSLLFSCLFLFQKKPFTSFLKKEKARRKKENERKTRRKKMDNSLIPVAVGGNSEVFIKNCIKGVPYILKKTRDANREACFHALLENEYIVTSYGSFDLNNKQFIVLEPMTSDIHQHILFNEMSLAELGSLFRNVYLGLVHIHSKGVVHTDIKLENLFIRTAPENSSLETAPNVEYKIGDLGSCLFIDSEEEDKQFQTFTIVPQKIGTPISRSPELYVSSTNIDYKNDVWSLGYCMAAALTRSSFFNSSEDEMYEEIKSICSLSLERFRDHLSKYNSEFLKSDYDTYVECVHRILTIDITKRPSLEEVGKLPYFASILK